MKQHHFLGKGIFVALMGAVILLSHSTQAKSKQLLLVDKNIQPRVIVAPSAAASEKHAAQELATYLQKICGRKIAVEETGSTPSAAPWIIVGHHPANADLKPETLGVEDSIIDVSARGIRIVGGKLPPLKLSDGTFSIQDRGTLYGVYEFLDSLGVRWYRPDPWGEHVPKMSKINVPLGRKVSKPAFKYRWSLNGYRYAADDKPETSAWAKVWAARNRQGTMTGTGAEMGGYYTIRIQHIYSILFPPDQYFETHPEYYALIDGVRRKDGQLCLGNPEVQKLAAEKLLAFAKANPQYEILSLEPEDHDKWCQCDLCKAMDDPQQKSIFTGINIEWERTLGDVESSNRVAKFGAIVAERVHQSNPKVKVLWLAYGTHSEPPSQVKSLPSNVRVMPAAFSSAFTDPQNSYSDYSRDLYDTGSTPNRNFVRVLKGYGKLAPLLTYEYWSGIAWVGPMPLIATMQDRLKNYRDLKMEGLYNESHPHWGPQSIDLYFFTRLSWNPDLDVKKELDLYCKNYYGPAYKPMLEYHQLLEKAAHSGIPHYSYGIGTHAIFTPPVVKKMGELISQADKLIAQNEPYRRRFDGVKAGYEYTQLVTPYFDELKKGNKLEAAKHWERANKFILSFPNGDVFDNGVLFGSLQFFGNYNLNIPADIQKQAKEFVAQESSAQP
jgi:hypothetical protein